ncbi:hypothetical protein LOK49_LG12G01063 [Camellia lanceoleosa]|uniref:Uncharacterized protein n=1 Tax=Camellia lanceoleosa TaxID=1840588 RepID=A0ACC0FNQ4_9ERIC|nr:hypothetical protein LOK49_LG12G01063 [Camellia lanceoleosa]
MALRFVLERTVKIKTGYVNPKLDFGHYSSSLGFPSSLLGGRALYEPLDHPEILRIARIAVKQYNRQQNTQLEFVRLLKAYKQSSVGTLFSLTLEAIDVGVKKKLKHNWQARSSELFMSGGL